MAKCALWTIYIYVLLLFSRVRCLSYNDQKGLHGGETDPGVYKEGVTGKVVRREDFKEPEKSKCSLEVRRMGRK